MTRQCAYALMAMPAWAAIASSQDVTGAVRDSATRQPVSGAVVFLLDSAGTTLARGLTNEAGVYRTLRTPRMRALRVVRMGYRPHQARLPEMRLETRVDVSMAPLATLLAPVSTSADAHCAARKDHARSLALFELARDGLQATIASREVNPATIKNLVFERRSEGERERILSQTVRINAGRAGHAFSAVRSAAGFVRNGFIMDSGGKRHYLGPDAETLLDPDFVGAYCFRLETSRERPRELGLGFFSAGKRPPHRVDIEGTLWVDTSARVVKSIEFTYVGLQLHRNVRPGGQIVFQEMPNGAVMISRWSFRLVDYERVATATGTGNFGETRIWYNMSEGGGEIAQATWENGLKWESSLGTVRLLVRDRDKRPATRLEVRLTGTDYTTRVDSAGVAMFTHVLPGPYKVEFRDTAKAARRIVLGSSQRVVAERGRVTALTLTAPPPDEFLRSACIANMTDFWTSVQVVRSSGKPAGIIEWTLGDDLGELTEHVVARGTTLEDSRLGFCHERMHNGSFQLRVAARDDARALILEVPHLLDKEFRVEMPDPQP